jgi:hypothetical protein
MHDNPLPYTTTPFHARQPPPSREPAPIICVSATNTSISQTPPLPSRVPQREIKREIVRNRKHEELMAMQRLAFWTFTGVLLSFVFAL